MCDSIGHPTFVTNLPPVALKPNEIKGFTYYSQNAKIRKRLVCMFDNVGHASFVTTSTPVILNSTQIKSITI